MILNYSIRSESSNQLEMNHFLNSQCYQCHKKFGISFVTSEQKAHMKSKFSAITSSIKKPEMISTYPIISSHSEKRRICYECFKRSQGCNNHLQIHSDMECNHLVPIDFDFFGRLMYEQYHKASFKTLIEKSIESLPSNVHFNATAIRQDLEKFVLRCNGCYSKYKEKNTASIQHQCQADASLSNNFNENSSQNLFIADELDKTKLPNNLNMEEYIGAKRFATIFCKDCNDFLCVECHYHVRYYQSHSDISIDKILKQNKCINHPKTDVTHVCLDCCLLICVACIVKKGHSSHKYLGLINDRSPLEKCQSWLSNPLQKSYKKAKIIEKILKHLAYQMVSCRFVPSDHFILGENVKELILELNKFIQNIEYIRAFMKEISALDGLDKNILVESEEMKLKNFLQSIINLVMSISKSKNPVVSSYNYFISQPEPSIEINMEQRKLTSSLHPSFIEMLDLIRQALYLFHSYEKNWETMTKNDFSIATSNNHGSSHISKQLTKKPSMQKKPSSRFEEHVASEMQCYSDDITNIEIESTTVRRISNSCQLNQKYGELTSQIENDENYQRLANKIDSSYKNSTSQTKNKASQYNNQSSNDLPDSRYMSIFSASSSSVLSSTSTSSSNYGSHDNDVTPESDILFNVGDEFSLKKISLLSPSHFTISNIRDASKSERFITKLKNWCQENIDLNSLSESEMESVTVGEMFVLFRNDLRLWARVRVVNLEKNNLDISQSIAEVVCLDYGHRGKHQLFNLKKIDPEFTKEQPLAAECYLCNLKPYDHDPSDNSRQSYVWSEHAAGLINDWIGTNEITVRILEANEDMSYGVDLVYNLDEKIRKHQQIKSAIALYDLSSTSLINILLKCKIGKLENEDEDEDDYISKIPRFMQMQSLYVDEKFTAEVAYFGSLNEFYLRKLYGENDRGDSFSDLSRHMSELYNNNKSSSLLTVYDPVEFMPVAVFYREDASWCRGEIVEVYPNLCTCKVLFVDYGNMDIVPIRDLRYLTKEFLVDDVRAFNCALFGITFKNENYAAEALQYIFERFRSPLFQNKIVNIHVCVKKIISTESLLTNKKDIHEIIMRLPVEGILTNINVILNKRGYAQVIDYSIFDGENHSMEPHRPRNEKNLSKKMRSTALEKILKEISTSGVKRIKSRPINSVPCRVTNAVSPSEIWVQDTADVENFYQKLQDSLNEIYDNKVRENENFKNDSLNHEWTVGELCILRVLRETYLRGRIYKVLPNDKYEVICLDLGTYEIAKKENLFLLEGEFRDKPDFKAKKCSLVGVLPLGTTNGEWSSLSKDFCEKTLNNMDVYVVFDSESVRNSNVNDNLYETTFYVDTKQNLANQVANDRSSEYYYRLADILNYKGYAILEEKKNPLYMLLNSENSFKTPQLLNLI